LRKAKHRIEPQKRGGRIEIESNFSDSSQKKIGEIGERIDANLTQADKSGESIARRQEESLFGVFGLTFRKFDKNELPFSR